MSFADLVSIGARLNKTRVFSVFAFSIGRLSLFYKHLPIQSRFRLPRTGARRISTGMDRRTMPHGFSRLHMKELGRIRIIILFTWKSLVPLVSGIVNHWIIYIICKSNFAHISEQVMKRCRCSPPPPTRTASYKHGFWVFKNRLSASCITRTASYQHGF